MMITWISAASIIIFLVLIFIFAVKPLFKEHKIITPSGNFKIGTILFELTDKNREEPALQDGTPRRLAVRVFYPAADDAHGEFLPASDPRIIKAFAKLYNFPSGGEDTPLPSNSIMNATPAEGGRFPVVLFSHGAVSYSTQNLSNFEALASGGYIVITLSHTYESLVTVFPNDEIIESSRSSMIRESMKITRAEAKNFMTENKVLISDEADIKKAAAYRELGAGFYKNVEELLRIRIEDFKFLLAELNHLNDQPEFLLSGNMDMEKIGIYGHSLGGITASYLCSDKNTQIKCGINMDAPIIQYDEEPVLQRPFTFFYSTETAIPKAGKINLSGCNDYYAVRAKEETFSITFSDTAHYNFSDFNFMPRIFSFTSMLGKINGLKMAKMLNTAVVDFFDYALKGQRQNMYGSLKTDLPELEISRH